jgi:hypothetical protein
MEDNCTSLRCCHYRNHSFFLKAKKTITLDRQDPSSRRPAYLGRILLEPPALICCRAAVANGSFWKSAVERITAEMGSADDQHVWVVIRQPAHVEYLERSRPTIVFGEVRRYAQRSGILQVASSTARSPPTVQSLPVRNPGCRRLSSGRFPAKDSSPAKIMETNDATQRCP